MTYQYTRAVDSDALKKDILAAGLPLTNIEINGGNAVSVTMSSELTTEQETELDTLVEAAALAGNPAAVVKDVILAAMDFGRNLMAEYGASNILAGLTMEQIKDVMDRTSKVQAALVTGSLYVALDELALVETDETIITEERRTVFRNKIQAYLGITLT